MINFKTSISKIMFLLWSEVPGFSSSVPVSSKFQEVFPFILHLSDLGSKCDLTGFVIFVVSVLIN